MKGWKERESRMPWGHLIDSPWGPRLCPERFKSPGHYHDGHHTPRQANRNSSAIYITKHLTTPKRVQ